MVECFEALAEDTTCRSVVFSGAGSTFTAGLDVMEVGAELMTPKEDQDVGRRAMQLRKIIQSFQRSFTVIEEVSEANISSKASQHSISTK